MVSGPRSRVVASAAGFVRAAFGARRGVGAGGCAWIALGAIMLAAAPFGGCAGRGRHAARPSAPDMASPVVRGAADGLEIWWWVVSDSRFAGPAPVPLAASDGTTFGPEAAPPPDAPAPPEPLRVTDLKPDLAELLSTYEPAPAPTDETSRARCRAAGLRLVAVPVDDLPAIERRLRLVGAVQRQWLGEPGEWTDVARGPGFGSPRVVDDGRDLRELSPGALRLMLRGWIVPDWSVTADGPGAALRVELAPEHLPASTERERFGRLLRDDAGRAGRPVRGTVFEGLGWSMVLRAGEACLIVPDSPGARWDQPPPDPGSPPIDSGIGPRPAAAPTLGEAMLSVERDEGVGRRVRAVIVLIPRVPDRYRLTAAAAP